MRKNVRSVFVELTAKGGDCIYINMVNVTVIERPKGNDYTTISFTGEDVRVVKETPDEIMLRAGEPDGEQEKVA